MQIQGGATKSLWMDTFSLPVTMWSPMSPMDCVLKASTDTRPKTLDNGGPCQPAAWVPLALSFSWLWLTTSGSQQRA